MVDPTYDIITGFQPVDRLQVNGQPFRATLSSSAGVLGSLAADDISFFLTTDWAAGSATAFSVLGMQGTFVALNDAIPGYQSASDAIVYLQNYNVSAANRIVLL